MTPESDTLELSVVMPCLNWVVTLASRLVQAQRAITQEGIAGEDSVTDNGSTHDSQAIAEWLVPVPQRRYWSALIGGIAATRGRFLPLGDADASYNHAEIQRFLETLHEGYENVRACRLEVVGGIVRVGTVPVLHRLWSATQ